MGESNDRLDLVFDRVLEVTSLLVLPRLRYFVQPANQLVWLVGKSIVIHEWATLFVWKYDEYIASTLFLTDLT